MDKCDNAAAKNKGGRPRKVINPEQISKLASLGCTICEIAAFFACHPDTISNNYYDSVDTGRALGRRNLRQLQFELARAGNATMLVWLGKNYLGQTDQNGFKLQEISDETLAEECRRRLEETDRKRAELKAT